MPNRRDQDRIVEVAKRTRAFAKMDDAYAAAGEAAGVVLMAYMEESAVTSEMVQAMCDAIDASGLGESCGKDMSARYSAVKASCAGPVTTEHVRKRDE